MQCADENSIKMASEAEAAELINATASKPTVAAHAYISLVTCVPPWTSVGGFDQISVSIDSLGSCRFLRIDPFEMPTTSLSAGGRDSAAKRPLAASPMRRESL